MRALVVPVKSFQEAKRRLESALDDAARARLARRLAATVLKVNGTADCFIACDDGEVADWASTAGATVLWTPGLGLSGAVEAGVAWCATAGYELAVVSHADLPRITSLAAFGAPGAVTLAPDAHLDGTNVAAVPTGANFHFSYGPHSFDRHRAEAARLGLPLHVVYDSRLADDVDVPADLVHAAALLDPAEDAPALIA